MGLVILQVLIHGHLWSHEQVYGALNQSIFYIYFYGQLDAFYMVNLLVIWATWYFFYGQRCPEGIAPKLKQRWPHVAFEQLKKEPNKHALFSFFIPHKPHHAKTGDKENWISN